MTGEAGTGKTTMLECLRDFLDSQRIEFAFIFNSRIHSDYFFEMIAYDLGLECQRTSKTEVLFAFNSMLVQQADQGRITALIMDEAHNLDWEVLEEIRLLGNMENRSGKLIRVILAGQPELERKVDAPNLRQLIDGSNSLAGLRFLSLIPGLSSRRRAFRHMSRADLKRHRYSEWQEEALMLIKLSTIAVLAAAALAAQDRFDLKVRTYFFAGFAGDTASLEKGMKMCEDALATDPRNAPALVWHGAGEFFESGQAFRKGDQQKGGELWQRGLKEMDDAVEMAPDDLGVRIPRGAVLLAAAHHLPNPEMARPLIEKGLQDFEKAYQIQASHLADMGNHPRGELFLGLADGYSRLGNQERAYVWFERMQNEMKGTPYEKSANAWFATKSLTPEQAGCLGCHTAEVQQK